jgi:TolB-like protein
MALGFPLAALLAWHYEWTADGIRTASEVPAAEAVRFTGRKLDFVIIGLLILAVAFLWIERDEKITADPNSIAVLPFANLSPDPENAYYAAGLHDEIMNQLAKLSALSLVSRTTVIKYADTTLTIPEIARELNVLNVIEGSVRFAGDRIRITMQLIDSVTDKHLWSETYDREFKDIFEIESDIAVRVAKALEAELSDDELVALDERPFESVEAYKVYLKSFVGSDLAAREAASLAIAADPENANAYVWRAYQGAMSFTHSDRPAARLNEQQMEQMAASVLADVDHALAQPERHGSHATAHLARALLHTQFWRLSEASADLDRAIELVGTESRPIDYHNLTWQLAYVGRCEEGISFGERSIEKWPDTQPAYAHLMLGMAYMCADRSVAAIEAMREAVKSNPDIILPQVYLFILELASGGAPTNPDIVEAFIAGTDIPTLIASYAYATALYVDKEKARAAIAKIAALEQNGARIGLVDRLTVALARGNREQAKEWIHLLVKKIESEQPDAGAPGLLWIWGNIIGDPILDEPEFVALRKQLRGQ